MNELILETELLSDENIYPLTTMTLECWPECNYEEEFEKWRQLVNTENDFCALAKMNNKYAGFIYITIRNDYVEGSATDKTAYLESIYIREDYRRKKIASLLLNQGEIWVKQKGFTQLASDTELENYFSQEFHKNVGFEEVSKIVCYLKALK